MTKHAWIINEITCDRTKHLAKQESIPVGCVPPALYHTRGISLTETLPPGQRPPAGQTSLDRDPPVQRPLDREPPGQRPPVNRMTDTCKNITLLQTSFAGGNNYHCQLWILRCIFLSLTNSRKGITAQSVRIVVPSGSRRWDQSLVHSDIITNNTA